MKWFQSFLFSLLAFHQTYTFAFTPVPQVSSSSKTANGSFNHFKSKANDSIPITRSALNLVGGASTVATIALPKLTAIVATSLTPTLLGFWKYEYGVSYAYGTATAGTAALILRSLLSSTTFTPLAQIAQLHAAAIVFYGIRLNIFLLYRELFLERFRKMRERIEEKRTKNGEGQEGILGRITSRAPFVLSCSFLYACLIMPALVSAQMSTPAAVITSSKQNALLLYKVLVCSTWFGFGLGAIGDFNKSLIKGIKGSDHLVTGGVYRFFRHPNYTGEMIGWTASFLASIASVFASSNELKLKLWKDLAFPLVTGLLGVVGISFVLLGATSSLELKQKEKYGEKKEYVQWIQKSWKGFTLAKKN